MTFGRLLIGLGSVVVLGTAVLIVSFLAVRVLQGGYTTGGDLVVGALLAALGAGAVAVLVRLYRGRPAGWLGGLVLLAGLGLLALVGLPYLFGVPFVY
ncbi:MAG: hypothetical protein ACRDFZ_03690 [Candidatus Limnocylindria bacterium]